MSSADELKAEGNKAFAAKDFDKAIDLFTQAIQASPTPNHVLYSNRSGAYASLKRYDEAANDAVECIKINEKWPKGYTRLATAAYGQGDLIKARDSYEQALRIDPSNAQAQQGMKQVDDAIAAEARADGVDMNQQEDMMNKMFKDPSVYDKLRNNEKTKDFLDDPAFVEQFKKFQENPYSVLGQPSTDPRIMMAVGVLLGVDAMGPPPDSSADPAESVPSPQHEPKKPKKEEKPKEPEPEPVSAEKKAAEEEKALGNTAYKAHKFDEAIAHYNKAFELVKDITYLNNRSAAEFEKGDYDAAIATCNESLEIGKETFADFKLVARAYSRLGNCYIKKDDLPNAVKAYEASLTEHRTADTLTKLRNAERDLAKREKEAYIDPAKAQEARDEGNAKFKAGDFPGAVKDYGEAIKRAPDDARGYANRAAAYLKLMAYPEVIKDCDIAIEKDPSFYKAYYRKATAYQVMREYRKCIDTLDQARAIDPEGKHANEINELYYKATNARFQSQAGETPEQTMERVQRDPEIVEILQDPVMRSILEQAQSNPAALMEHMKNSEVKKKIDLLIAAGIIRTR